MVYYSFLQVAKGNFIGKKLSKYVFAKLQVKIERNFYQRFFEVIKKESPPWMFSKSYNFLQIIFRWEQRKKNNNITSNSSKSDISTLLTLLSADVLLRLPSLTKVEASNLPLLHFPKWFCLVYGQHALSLQRVKRC